MVESLAQMTIERLQLYQKKNKRLPDRIIVYRDGVSEVREPLPTIYHSRGQRQYLSAGSVRPGAHR